MERCADVKQLNRVMMENQRLHALFTLSISEVLPQGIDFPKA